MSVRDKDLERLVLDRTPAEGCEDELDYAVVDRVYGVAPPRRPLHGTPLAANAAEHED